jgi:hypothetical protein
MVQYQSPDAALFKGRVDNNFYQWLPYAEFSGSLTRNTWLNLDYGITASEPTIENLLPVVDFSNPLFITEGNPDLVPPYTQSQSRHVVQPLMAS